MPGLWEERADRVEGNALRTKPVLPILHEAREQMKTLVERLRKLSAENPSPRDCIDEAADELEKADPCRVAGMTWHCQNIDHDSQGWYATIYVSERGEHVCGRGNDIWAAVQEAHRLAANV